MQNNYFLERIICYIEDHISEILTIETIAEEFHISTVYLKKMFQSFFQMPISHYIRKRRLSLSAKQLLEKEYRIIDVALQYGFTHTQTYINAFKKEFGLTPYQWKRQRTPSHYTEKLSCEFILETKKGILVMPETVILPALCLSGVVHHLGFQESRTKAPQVALSFWENDYPHIKHVIEKNVYYGVTLHFDPIQQESDYYCCAHVSKFDEKYTDVFIESHRYMKFIYVGEHSYTELSADSAKTMYQAIADFFHSQVVHHHQYEPFYFERVDLHLCSHDFCVMEWYIPYN